MIEEQQTPPRAMRRVGWAFLIACLALTVGMPSSPVWADALIQPATALPAREKAAFDLIIRGSLEVSRTKAAGRRFMAPDSVKDKDIASLAEVNFRKAAQFVVVNASTLPLNQKTAETVNRMLTKGLVPENVRGDAFYRGKSTFGSNSDRFVGGNVKNFYKWLGKSSTSEAKVDSIKVAEMVHHNMSALDSFPDGNGRTARLMADLVLLKHGHGPALYPSMKDYFARGNARSEVSRDELRKNFRAMVGKGTAELAQHKGKGLAWPKLKRAARSKVRPGVRRTVKTPRRTRTVRARAR